VSWTEADSRLYQQLAAIAVPDRAEQVAALLTLLPVAPDEPARVVELGCGEGKLSAAVLDAFPRASVLALDGSADMRRTTAQRLADFGDRARVEPFELGSDAWWFLVDGADAVISSLAVHHLDGPGKQRLFRALAERLSERGALLMADLVEPRRAEARELFSGGWDDAARRQSGGSDQAYTQFLETHWNLYRFPDPVDMPSPLFDQLLWLREAGFVVVDCFWLRAAHAIYGGYRAAARSAGAPLEFDAALAAARRALA
jgi:SAM-dependent methyltransferase